MSNTFFGADYLLQGELYSPQETPAQDSLFLHRKQGFSDEQPGKEDTSGAPLPAHKAERIQKILNEIKGVSGTRNTIKNKKIRSLPATEIVARSADTNKMVTDSPSKPDSASVLTAAISQRQFKLPDIISKQGHNGENREVAPKATGTVTMFQPHSLAMQHPHPMALNRDRALWPFFVLLLILLVFTFVKVLYNKTIRQILAAFFSNVVTNQVVRDENVLVQRASVLLTIVFNLAAAFYLYYISVLYGWSSDYIGAGFGRFLVFALIISFAYTFKFIILKLTGFIFLLDKAFVVYIFNIFLINNVLGIALIPIVIALSFLSASYQPYLVVFSFILIGIAYCYRVVRGVLIGLSSPDFSGFYLFLYLCALEISPLLILLKWARA